MFSGKLTLIPTPLCDETPLEEQSLNILKSACTKPDQSLFVFEEPKNARRRWLSWGLEREFIEQFQYLNEHSDQSDLQTFFGALKSGKELYLMSDGGLPCFCDPGVALVDYCHRNGLSVTSAPFAHSVALAIALSGIDCKQYNFEGFIARDKSQRINQLKGLIKQKKPTVIMDTPYRLKALLEQLAGLGDPFIFLAMDLGRPTEQLLRGSVRSVQKSLKQFKREFVLILS